MLLLAHSCKATNSSFVPGWNITSLISFLVNRCGITFFLIKSLGSVYGCLITHSFNLMGYAGTFVRLSIPRGMAMVKAVIFLFPLSGDIWRMDASTGEFLGYPCCLQVYWEEVNLLRTIQPQSWPFLNWMQFDKSKLAWWLSVLLGIGSNSVH